MECRIFKDYEKLNISEITCDIGWVVVDAYLDGIEISAQQLLADPEFNKMFNDLRHYTDLQLYGDETSKTIDLKVIAYRERSKVV